MYWKDVVVTLTHYTSGIQINVHRDEEQKTNIIDEKTSSAM
jgi:hypothetical protein